MKRKQRWFMLILFPFLFLNSCSDKKTLDLGSYEITVPKSWEFKPIKSFDSYAGNIVGPGVNINFDYSNQGFANHLISSEKHFLLNGQIILENHPDDHVDTSVTGELTLADMLSNGRFKPILHKDTTVKILKITE